MGRAATRDITDAVVARTAADLHADVVTGDRADIHRLLRPPTPPATSSTSEFTRRCRASARLRDIPSARLNPAQTGEWPRRAAVNARI